MARLTAHTQMAHALMRRDNSKVHFFSFVNLTGANHCLTLPLRREEKSTEVKIGHLGGLVFAFAVH